MKAPAYSQLTSTIVETFIGPRIQRVTRLVFYVVTLSATAIAVMASVAGGNYGAVLMRPSWSLIVTATVIFAFMLLLNLVVRDKTPASSPGVSDKH